MTRIHSCWSGGFAGFVGRRQHRFGREYLRFSHLKGLHLRPCFSWQAGLELALEQEYGYVHFGRIHARYGWLGTVFPVEGNTRQTHTRPVFNARDTVDDKMAGFAVGADDYMVKPFELRELFARMQAIHKRTIGSDRLLQVRGSQRQYQTGEVRRQGETIVLSANIYQLLVVLMQRSPSLCRAKPGILSLG